MGRGVLESSCGGKTFYKAIVAANSDSANYWLSEDAPFTGDAVYYEPAKTE